ncbi:hypothetical protein [Candidatus Nitrosocosmicus sp. R]
MDLTRILLLLILVFLLYFTQSTFHAVLAETKNILFKEKSLDSKSSRLDVNNTFALSGFLVSTLNTSLIPNNGSNENNQLITSSPLGMNIQNSYQTESPTQRNDSVISTDSLQSNMNLSQSTREDTTGTGQLNQTDNLSNNLVSMLSGIIIQSIEKGNPTISNYVNANDSGSLINTNISTIVSGNWEMNINSSKVEFFDSKFVMISSNARGFHWHTVNNFNGDGNVFFGNDDTIFIDGTVDFFTDDKLVSENSKVVLILNNFELIQIIFLDNKIADHFHNFPLYGIIDSIEIKN